MTVISVFVGQKIDGDLFSLVKIDGRVFFEENLSIQLNPFAVVLGLDFVSFFDPGYPFIVFVFFFRKV